MKNRIYIITIFVLIIFGILCNLNYIKRYLNFNKNPSTPICNKCNVIIIDIDHIRSDSLPCYGYKYNTAPNLCGLAKNSAIFENNFSHSHWTLPSVASTLTSLYPAAHNVYVSYKDSISDKIPTLTEVLKAAGYMTAFIGPKEGDVQYLPIGFKRGVDKRLPLSIDKWNDVIDSLEKSDKPFFAFFYAGDLHIPYTLLDKEKLIAGTPRILNFPDTRLEIDKLMAKYIANNYKDIFTQKAINKNTQLFKNPNQNTREIFNYYNSSENSSSVLKAWFSVKYAAIMEYLDQNAIGNKEITKYLKEVYDTGIYVFDRELGSILNRIKSGTLNSNTIVVIMSDHGDGFGEHNSFAHYNTLYNEVIHTPLIIYSPKVKPIKVRSISENIDIYPTVLNLIGVPINHTIQGKSLTGLMSGQTDTEKVSIGEINENWASIQNQNWKLIADKYKEATPSMELYYLPTDKYEQLNLVSKNPKEASDLLRKLRNIMNNSRNLYPQKPNVFPTWIDEDSRKRLIEKGYF